MGDENTVLDQAEARHLLRRSGFGVKKEDVDRILRNDLTRGQAADELVNFTPKKFKPRGRFIEDVHNKWIKNMVRTKLQLQEKLVLFFHDHFATGNDKVNDPELMTNQNLLFRLLCRGSFKDLVTAVNLDAAMMEYLDTVRNRKQIPNENYARELQELFTLGVKDRSGNDTYTQTDIVQIARAFTGWGYEDGGAPEFRTSRHDYMVNYPERGPKVIYKTLGAFGNPAGQSFSANGEGEPEIGRVIDIIFQHRDTNGKNTVARHIGGKLIAFFSHPNPSTALIDAVVAESSFDVEFNIAQFLRALFVRDEFYATIGAPTSVKWPVDYVVGTLRTLRMKLRGKYQYVNGGSYAAIRDQLLNMGQLLLEPPSVFGWDWESSWVSSATLLARDAFARDLTAARSGGGASLRPEKLINLGMKNGGDIVTAVANVLGVVLTAAEKTILVNYLTDNHPDDDVDLFDDDIRNVKLHGVFVLLMQSPAFQLH